MGIITFSSALIEQDTIATKISLLAAASTSVTSINSALAAVKVRQLSSATSKEFIMLYNV